MLVSEGHQQAPYELPAAWDGNLALKPLLKRSLPSETFATISQDCQGFQERLAGPIHDLRMKVEEPSLIQYNQWGQRIDTLKTSEGWRGLKKVAAEEGLVAIPYERKEGSFSRTYAFVKTYLWLPECGYVGCPMAMTDGCARVLELAGTTKMKQEILPSLTSRDPEKAWTAGQWMTEKPGGSDVSLTETVAKPLAETSSAAPKPGDSFVLDGFKWFSSATDGNVALALARTGGEGSRGLSLFAVKMRKEDGKTNGIFIHRLKRKFGTKAVPTAELSLEGCIGQLVGQPGDGVRIISSVLNITRLHSAVTSVASLRRALDIASGFARVRHVGGKDGSLLSSNEMHTSVLASSELVHRALLQVVFGTIGLLGKSEAEPLKFTEEEGHRLRLLTPVVKSFAADLASKEIMGCMEALGGQGQMEENEIGRLVADQSVERIWEGTTNVLALDVVRVILKSKGASIKAFVDWATVILTSLPAELDLAMPQQIITTDLALLEKAAKAYFQPTPADLRLARPLLYLIGFLASSIHLVEQAVWSHGKQGEDREVDRAAAERWSDNGGVREARRTIEKLLRRGDEVRKREARLDAALVYGSKL